jgi:hypothetical protein
MRLIQLLLLLIIALPLQGLQKYTESSHYANGIYSEKIKTVQLYKEGWNLSYPIIKLNSDEKLILQFDLLDDQAETYYYTFVHCNKEWEKSDIFTNDYLEGYPENPIEDYKSSFNTTVSYYHYRLNIPNENVSFSLSGNYALFVYPVHKPEEPVIIQRFIITEDAAKIDVSAHRPQMTKENNTHQQIDFSVNYAGLNINDPYRNIYAFILQNGRWDNAKKDLKPEFYGNNELKYSSLSDKNIFMGGNEYRYFDIRSLRYQTEYVKEIEYNSPFYNVILTTSESREFKPYFYWQDFNGKYYIAVQEGRDSDTDADYVYVYFTLSSRQSVPGGDIYVSGNLNNWALNSNNKMTYNYARGEYECTMLLKQGWYNYEYVFLENNSSAGNSSLFEGSHYETENDYIVLIYYRNPRDRYDRVIGSVTANTLNRMTR